MSFRKRRRARGKWGRVRVRVRVGVRARVWISFGVLVAVALALQHPAVGRFHERHEETMLSAVNNVTILFITYQITVNLSTVHVFKGGSA